MAVLRRILLALWGAVFCAGAGVLAVALVSPAFAAAAVNFLQNCLLYNIEETFLKGQNTLLTLAVGLALLVLGIFLLYVAFYRSGKPRQVVVAAMDGGEVQVSFHAIDNVVKKAAAGVPGVSNIENAMSEERGGLQIRIGLALSSQVSAPEISMRVRRAIEDALSATLGIIPLSIGVTVTRVLDNGSLPPKAPPTQPQAQTQPEPVAWAPQPPSPAPKPLAMPEPELSTAAEPLADPAPEPSFSEEMSSVPEPELNAPELPAPPAAKSPWQRMKERKHGSK